MNNIVLYQYTMNNISPLLVGTGYEGVDSICKVENRFVIPGTTLMGAYRDLIKKYEKFEMLNRFFEYDDKEKKHINSPVVFYDAASTQIIDNLGENLIQRNRVAIDAEYGSAKENALSLNEYAIQKQMQFSGYVEIKRLERYLTQVDTVVIETIEVELKESVDLFLAMLLDGQIAIGKNANLGYGLFSTVDDGVKFTELNLKNETDFNTYLNFYPSFETTIQAVNNKDLFGKKLVFDQAEILKASKESKAYTLKFKGFCEDGLIIKGQRDKNKDLSYKEKDNKGDSHYLIPASSVKGVFRAYCTKILKTMQSERKINIEDQDIQTLMATIFGGSSSGDFKEKPVKGIVKFKDVVLKPEREQGKCTYNRVKIDRFTGGVYTGAVFSAQACLVEAEDPMEIEIEFAQVSSKDKTGEDRLQLAIYLLCLTLRDLDQGLLSIGNSRNVGYGFVKGINIEVTSPSSVELYDLKDVASDSNSAFMSRMNATATDILMNQKTLNSLI